MSGAFFRLHVSAVSAASDVHSLVKFRDDYLLHTLAYFARRIFELEMDIRRALSFIYLASRTRDFYCVLNEDEVHIQKGDGPADEPSLARNYENELFHILFSDYGKLNTRRTIKHDDLLTLIRNSASFDDLRNEVERTPITDEQDREFVTSLKPLLHPIEKLRNCVAHNRTPSRSALQDFEMAATNLSSALDGFFLRQRA